MNKMIRKSTNILLALIMLLSVFGCSKQENTESEVEATNVEATLTENNFELSTTQKPSETTTKAAVKKANLKDIVIPAYKKIISHDQYNYSLYDIDKNGLPELFVQYSNEDYRDEIIDIYSFKAEKAFKLTTIRHSALGKATIPNENGVLILGWDDLETEPYIEIFGSIFSLENGDTLKEKNLVTDDFYLEINGSLYSTEGMLNDGSDPSNFIGGSEWIDYYPADDLFMLSVCFDKYTSEKPAYKKIIENYRNKPAMFNDNSEYTEYALYDIDKNGITELILMYKDEYNNLCGSIYTIIDNKINYCGDLYSDDKFYEEENNGNGILCKTVSDDGTYTGFDLYELKNGDLPDYPKTCLSGQYERIDDGWVPNYGFYYYYSPIDEAEFLDKMANLKEIKTYNIDDLSALDLL